MHKSPWNPPDLSVGRFSCYGYSFSQQEIYQGRYPSAQAAADAAFGNEPERDGVWVAKVRPPDLADLIDIDGILDDIQEAADDLCGEASEEWLDHLMADKEAKADLEKMVADWLRVRAPIDFCTAGDERYFKR